MYVGIPVRMYLYTLVSVHVIWCVYVIACVLVCECKGACIQGVCVPTVKHKCGCMPASVFVFTNVHVCACRRVSAHGSMSTCESVCM